MNLFFDISFFETSLFFELSLVIAIGALVAIIMRMLRQPLIVSHILTGLIVGPFFLNFIHSFEIFKLFSEIGISILLFTVGLNLSPHLIKQFGKISLFTGIGQVLVTSILGYTIARFLGYENIVSMYIGLGLAFSSTIIILKLLSDKNELETLHAKIATGFLLVQDFIALILLFSIPIISNPEATSLDIITTFCKGAVMAGVIWLIANKVLKPLNNFFLTLKNYYFYFHLVGDLLLLQFLK